MVEEEDNDLEVQSPPFRAPDDMITLRKVLDRWPETEALLDEQKWKRGFLDRTKSFLTLIAKIAATALATLGILEFFNRHGPGGHP